MITTFIVIDTIYAKIAASALDIATNGELYKLKRPLDSTKEDIVINCLPISGEQVQLATANVNIHVPDILLDIDGKEQFMPDTVRLKTLADMADSLLKDVSAAGYYYYIASQATLQDQNHSTPNHFINVRIEFRSYNNL